MANLIEKGSSSLFLTIPQKNTTIIIPRNQRNEKEIYFIRTQSSPFGRLSLFGPKMKSCQV